MDSFYNKVMVPKQAPWWENIYLISDSFTEFLEGLYDYDIDEQGNEISRYQDGTITNLGTNRIQNFQWIMVVNGNLM